MIVSVTCTEICNTDGSQINSVSYNATSFTLSCITSGGIATYINEDDCDSKQQLVSFSQHLMDPITLRYYDNVLRWGSQGQSSYICSTRNREALSYAVLLTDFGIGKPQFSKIENTLSSNNNT